MKTFYCGLVNINATEIPFCFEFELLRIQPYWFTLLPTKSRKRMAHDINEWHFCHTCLTDEVTDTDCTKQKGCGFVTFKCGCLTTQPFDQLKNCFKCIIFLIPFLSKGPVMLLHWESPLKREKEKSALSDYFFQFFLGPNYRRDQNKTQNQGLYFKVSTGFVFKLETGTVLWVTTP